ncbi:unnamed protein product, partial [Trichobilharzia regenti]
MKGRVQVKVTTLLYTERYGPCEPLVIEEVEVSPPMYGEVRIKVYSSGVCHTDAYCLSGHDPEGVFPTILGHEGAGVVESVGDGVTSLSPGDHVIPLYIPQCNEETQGAGLMPDGSVRFKCGGQQIHHFMGCSTFSEYTVLPEISVAKIEKNA